MLGSRKIPSGSICLLKTSFSNPSFFSPDNCGLPLGFPFLIYGPFSKGPEKSSNFFILAPLAISPTSPVPLQPYSPYTDKPLSENTVLLLRHFLLQPWRSLFPHLGSICIPVMFLLRAGFFHSPARRLFLRLLHLCSIDFRFCRQILLLWRLQSLHPLLLCGSLFLYHRQLLFSRYFLFYQSNKILTFLLYLISILRRKKHLLPFRDNQVL